MGDLQRAWTAFVSRSPAERTRLIRRALEQVRAGGVSGALRWARGGGAYARALDRYGDWCRAHTPDGSALAGMRAASERFRRRPVISIITAVFNTDTRWLEAAADSVLDQAYPYWQWSIADDGSSRLETRQALSRIAVRDPRILIQRAGTNQGISAASNLALSRATGEFVALLDHDDALLPHALYRMVERLNEPGPEPDVLYSDEDKLDRFGQRCDPYFKPDWAPDLLRSSMYACHLLVIRRALIEAAGGFRSAFDFAQDYDLLLRVIEGTEHVAHVPDVLYHWRKSPASAAASSDAKPAAHDAGARALQASLDRRNIPGRILDAGAPGLYRVKYDVVANPRVSILIVTHDPDAPAPARTLRALAARTGYPLFDVTLLSETGRAPRDGPEGLEVAAIKAAGPLNVPAWINQGAQASKGSHLLVLHEAIEPLDPGWLEALLELSAQPWIGAVGAKLLDRTGAVGHIGFVIDPNGRVCDPFQGRPEEGLPYYAGANCIRNRTAVSAACLITRRDVFESVNGFDEALASPDVEVDYCLRLADRGLRIVFTPYARLIDHSAGAEKWANCRQSNPSRLRERWGSRLDADPLDNPHLARHRLDGRVR